MIYFFRSIVGKLWMTIILLVLVVLAILSVLLLQFFERFYMNEAEEDLTNRSELMASVLEGYDDSEEALQTMRYMANAFDTKVSIFSEEEIYWMSADNNEETIHLPPSVFLEEDSFDEVFAGEEVVTLYGEYPVGNEGEQTNEMLIVGVPLDPEVLEGGTLFLYQSLAVIEDTTSETQRIILLSGGIAIIMTTVFAFFLSTRITAPLRKMRQVTLEVAEGKFDTKVPILTKDEIGQLANAFNRMRRELNRNINALNQEKEQFSRILTSMADGVITIDRKGKIVVTNPPADRFLQAYAYEVGIDHREQMTEQMPKDIKKLFQQVVALEKEQATEFDVQGRSYAIVMTPLYDGEFVRGVVAVIRDMTEERQHDKLRKDFIANVSHELRTPISMLQGYSEAIIDDMAPTEEEKKEIGQIIYDESNRMGRLVNELLDLARMEAGHIQLQPESVNVGELLKRMERKFQGMAKENNLSMKAEETSESHVVEADPDRLEQVLTNLISNAIRHTEDEGEVLVRSVLQQDEVVIEVEDTGVGIPEEDLPFVFERFYKADKARTRGRSGTGLGLAIAKNIIEAHEGRISVQSKEGEGTLFQVNLSLYATDEQDERNE
ncbi:ATP-binding protein [Salsuginibacillus kocurii]|uniref:ATP-binding protein n=1 Tax=Salsuginibacillus kocurii TaxID=427078 RepID=UPI000373FA4E|nr:ATP-binding protein [Salsuginibacillus kocurii]